MAKAAVSALLALSRSFAALGKTMGGGPTRPADRDWLRSVGFEPGGWSHPAGPGELPVWVFDPASDTYLRPLPSDGYFRMLEAHFDDDDPAPAVGYYSFHASSRGGWQQLFSRATRRQVRRILLAFDVRSRLTAPAEVG